MSHWNRDRWLRLGRAKWSGASNSERWSASGWLGATSARGWRSGRRHGQPVAAAHWSWLYMALQTSVFDETFTYIIEVTWQTYFAHLGMTVGNNDGRCWWGQFGPSSASMSMVSRAPPAKMKAPMWVSYFNEAPGAVDLAPRVWARGEQNLTDSVLIYRGFHPIARDRCGLKPHVFFPLGFTVISVED
jgi:hypothetical protein